MLPRQRVQGRPYAFSGYAYDENCHMVSWPAGGGAACSGAFAAPPGEGGSELMANSVVPPKPDSSHVKYAFAIGTVPSQVKYPVGFVTDCSVPASQLTCMQSWDPPGASQSAVSATTVRVERVRVIK